ncbi:hypothetical protein FHX05_005820 [Rhizobium sp. BK491]|nr:hypothetical protein [Rhizobium sp. BK491]
MSATGEFQTVRFRNNPVAGSNPLKAVILTLVELLLSMQSVVQQESRRLCCLGAKPVELFILLRLGIGIRWSRAPPFVYTGTR